MKEGREIMGFAFCGINHYIAVVGLKLCQVQFLYIKPEFRKGLVGGKAIMGMLRGVEQWAEKQGAKDISFSLEIEHITPGLKRLVVRSGYRLDTAIFVRG